MLRWLVLQSFNFYHSVTMVLRLSPVPRWSPLSRAGLPCPAVVSPVPRWSPLSRAGPV